MPAALSLAGGRVGREYGSMCDIFEGNTSTPVNLTPPSPLSPDEIQKREEAARRSDRMTAEHELQRYINQGTIDMDSDEGQDLDLVFHWERRVTRHKALHRRYFWAQSQVTGGPTACDGPISGMMHQNTIYGIFAGSSAAVCPPVTRHRALRRPAAMDRRCHSPEPPPLTSDQYTQASSVPCEQVFSSSKETITQRRTKMSPDLLSELQLLKFSYKQNRLSFTSSLVADEKDYAIEGKVTDTAVRELLKAGKYEEREDLLRNE
ncbi:hypothetical protein C8T65DRAFT_736744 [Cerioporus squamosus]|nr:hypothetical protein C8T65DRAFT_736744 [Cerioporus squamosus]